MRIVLSLAIIGGMVLLARRLGPQLRSRCVVACERMFDEMPDSFPPKRIMGNLEALRAQGERMIELLEEQGRAS
jgi:hypothetical protein